MRSTHWKLPLLASASLLALVSVMPAQSADIGQVAAVNRDMDGTPPDTAKRQLELGFGVVENERIETSDRGSGQLLFVDQTSLTVSQNSDIILDKYVYDASADQGDMAMTMTKGALRFIGGRITKKRRAMVRTPTATIGIRGGLVIIRVLADGSTRVVQMAGDSTTVESYGDADGDGVDDGPPAGDLESYFAGTYNFRGRVVILSRAGATAEIQSTTSAQTGGTGGTSGSSEGGSREPSDVVYVGIITTEELSEEYEGFEGGRSGGTDTVPSDQGVNETSEEIASVNSEQTGGANNQPVSTSGEQPPAPPDPLLETVQDEPPIVEAEQTSDIEDLTDFEFDDPVDPIEPVPPTDTSLSGGAITIDGSPLIPFSSVQTGSIIGILPIPIFGVEQVTLNLPLTPVGLQPGGPGQSLFAETRFPNSGFFQVQAQFDPGATIALADGFAVFSNATDAEFVVAEGNDAFLFFGRPTPGQNQAFVSDPLLNSGGRSITAYQVENLSDATLQTDSSTFNVISNGPGDGDGARAFFAALDIDSDAGTRELSVAAGAVGRESNSGPGFSFTVLSIGTDDLNNAIGVNTEILSSFRDFEGNSLFGPENDFILVGGPNGIETEFILTDASAVTNAFTSDFTLLTRDPSSRLVVNDPDPILGNTPLREVPSANSYDSVLATGFASCGNGRSCSSLSSSYYTLFPDAIVPGADASTAGSLVFNTQANSFSGNFILAASGGANTVPTTGPFNQNFSFSIDTRDSAAFTDQFFAGATAGTALQAIPGAGNPTSDLVLASAQAVGAEQLLTFPNGVDAVPNFATWGFWAASYTVVDSVNQQQGRDVVDLGTFVAGVRPDPVQFSNFQGTAGFSGPVVATSRSQLQPGLTDVGSNLLAGDFDLQYDFGDADGTLTLNLPDIGLTANGQMNGAVNNPGDPSYSGGISGGNFTGFAQGSFYTGGQNLVAATGGRFDLLDSSGGQQIVGIFAGDRE
ncbi:MAG: FecR domain-containing protein [Pseudomonadota bacterium]